MNLKNNLTYLRINAEKYYFLKNNLKKEGLKKIVIRIVDLSPFQF